MLRRSMFCMGPIMACAGWGDVRGTTLPPSPRGLPTRDSHECRACGDNRWTCRGCEVPSRHEPSSTAASALGGCTLMREGGIVPTECASNTVITMLPLSSLRSRPNSPSCNTERARRYSHVLAVSDMRGRAPPLVGDVSLCLAVCAVPACRLHITCPPDHAGVRTCMCLL